MSTTPTLDTMGEQRRAILVALKISGPLSIGELAERLGVSYEAVRQHLTQLRLDGWVTREIAASTARPGRPKRCFRLTAAGDHLFPKAYDDLAVALIDAVADRLGPEALRRVLETVAKEKVEAWRPSLEGRPLSKRLSALTNIYQADDPYCTVERAEDGTPQLVEMNCPYLSVAKRRPALCSVTVSVLRRLLGRRVVRVERFQEGHGRCVFAVGEPEPAQPSDGNAFEWEPPAATVEP